MKIIYGPGGSILCDTDIEGMTQKLDAHDQKYYGAEYFLCESAGLVFCRFIAKNMGAELIEYDLVSKYPDE